MTPNVLNEIASANSKTFTYDADGDLLTDYGRAYKWDAANRLVSIAMGSSNPSVTFSYDGLGRRVKKTVTQPNRGGNATTTYLWCGQTLCMAQYGGGVTRRYVAEGEVYTSGGTTTPYYYGPDQLGPVRDVFNATSGALLAHYDYDAYGLGTGVAYGTVTGTSKLTDFGYAGMLYESTSGISLANYRAYDPQTARWMSRDPIGEAGGINLYQYAGGNPVSNTDPSGLDCVASGNSVTCTPAGGQTVTFPRPAGWLDNINPNNTFYHHYDIPVNSNCPPSTMQKGIANNPTPGSPSPATPGGTPNNATPSNFPPIPSPVISYLEPNGTVVNVTQPGHPLFPGYVERTVGPNGSGSVVNNYGEGSGFLQSPYSPFAGDINNVCQGQTNSLSSKCGCK